jgi:N-acetylmuramoyl-L-alanine amidase
MAELMAIPSRWVERYAETPERWWRKHATHLERRVPDIRRLLARAARLCQVDERLLICMAEKEQSAWSYAWDGSTPHYGGGLEGDAEKLRWLLGVDKTDSGPRPGAWAGPWLQLLGCAARFRWLYRGMVPPPDLGLPRLPKGLGPTTPLWEIDGVRAANEATAMAFRYTPHLSGNERLKTIGMDWFGDDYPKSDPVVGRQLLIWLDPGHGTRKRDGSLDTGTSDTSGLGTGLNEKDVVLDVALEASRLLAAEGHDVRLTHRRADYSETLGYSDRGAMAAGSGYDCYISLHLDSARDLEVRGTTVFIPKTPSRSPRSRTLATALATELRAELGTPVSYADARPSGVMPHWYNLGTFVGGGNNYSPGALALPEPLFMSSPEDMAIIGQPGFAARYAVAVCRGIHRYAGLPVPHSWRGPGSPTPSEAGWEAELGRATEWATARGISDGRRLDEPMTRGEYLVMRYREAKGE